MRPINTDASISLALKQISNTFANDANRELKRIGLTVSQAELLFFLYHTPLSEVTQRDIEVHLNLKHPTVIGLLERLRKKGFVQCVVNQEDRRCRTVLLTEKAHAVRQEMERRRQEMERHLLKGIPEDHQAFLISLLNRMLSNIAHEGDTNMTGIGERI